jgi:hypothetical protein
VFMKRCVSYLAGKKFLIRFCFGTGWATVQNFTETCGPVISFHTAYSSGCWFDFLASKPPTLLQS